MQEQKPGRSMSSTGRKSSKMLQPPAMDDMDQSEMDHTNANDDNDNKTPADDDRSQESARHESPRSKLREAMDMINQLRYRCGTIVNNENVQFFIVILIAVNAIMMGVGTFDFVTENPEVDHAFETTDKVFLVIFTIELVMQFIFHGWRLLLDGWLVFDLIVIAMSWTFSQVQIIRAFRIFRALRLITRIEVMKNLVLALFGVMPRMCAIGILLFLVSYIFAVMFTQLFKDLYAEGATSEDYFGRMDGTFFTLFQIMTLDSWADIAREVMVVHRWAWLPFISFVIITGFIVVNLIIAVICDAISALNDDEKAKLEGQFDTNKAQEADEDSQNGDGEGANLPEADVQEQLDSLEAQVEELTRVQVQTLYTLEYLARQLQRSRAMEERNEGL
ncbi:dependent L-type calcium channel subunit alpha [Seminavis robusta]|uniref:Dependent L-type calcium channel subunit alpha n=1 Tax=Seminavis robusta TaxID=568900 RepID=A0A9N8DCT3_9STRA|nr:dependent L-type calcium channel subunit alpha [Seminavis robusta]|eukprot:Sro37_g023360.1 dependent L-type calcium channel subunit alpha (390) ;mRNA; f:117506-118753